MNIKNKIKTLLMSKKKSDNSFKFEIKEIKEEKKNFFQKYSIEDIDKFFDSINENKILGWVNKLEEFKLNFRNFSEVTDADILSEEFNDKKASKIIKGDIERTKVLESIYMSSFKDYLYQFIIYYVNKNKILYKQGLNEIAGPFILLKFKLKLSFTKIYTMFTCFIDKFLTNYFLEKEFYSLKSSLSLINLLLKYHCPDIFLLFENALICPDLYATSWLLTLFANKCSLNFVYYLWDKLILFEDPLFIHFFIVAFLNKKKNKFFEIDSSGILSILSKLRINSLDEINEIIDTAIELRNNTPNSFYLFAKYLEIFNYGSNNLKKLYEEYNPNNMLAMPIFESEVLNINYKDLIGCSEQDCKNFIIKNKNNEKKDLCAFCKNRYLKQQLYYIIFDLRLFNSDENKYISSSFPGFLPKTVTLTKEDFNNENFPKNILKEYLSDKEKTHFIIMTSETENFIKYENEYYIRKKDRRGSKVGVFFKAEKELNKIKADELKKKSKEKYLSLIEYNNFKKLIEEMNKEGFKNVSFVYGGYKYIHSLAMKNGIELLEHKEKCFLCENEKKNNNKGFFKFFK